MKKLVLSLAVVFAVGMVSCGGGENKDANDTTPVEVTETEMVGVEEVTPDSAAAPETEAPADSAAETAAPADSAK